MLNFCSLGKYSPYVDTVRKTNTGVLWRRPPWGLRHRHYSRSTTPLRNADPVHKSHNNVFEAEMALPYQAEISINNKAMVSAITAMSLVTGGLLSVGKARMTLLGTRLLKAHRVNSIELARR